jgi:hypothetical protein
MKKLLVLALSTVLSVSGLTAYADNSNPPLIQSFEEITTGPYSVGDLVTFKVSYVGGNPGIKSIKISGAYNSNSCLSQTPSTEVTGPLSGSQLTLGWTKQLAARNDNFELISGFVMPCLNEGSLPTGVNVLIEDETGLKNGKLFPYTLSTVSDNFFTSVGEIKPKKIPDQISIKNIPKNPKKNSLYKLPRLTQGGVPVFWFVPTGSNNPKESVCSIQRPFDGDLGGNIKFKKSGSCILNAWPMPTDKFAYPTYVAQTPLTTDERSGQKNSFVYKIK